MQTPERFRSLAELLTPRAQACAQDAFSEEIFDPEEPAPLSEDWVRDVKLFHARVADAVDEAVHTLLEDIAADVLARELQLAPADVTRIVRCAIERFASEEPLRVRVHSGEAQDASAIGLPVVADPALRPGDAVLELRWGEIDARLGVRLESILERLP